jgi:hypothetical protein
VRVRLRGLRINWFAVGITPPWLLVPGAMFVQAFRYDDGRNIPLAITHSQQTTNEKYKNPRRSKSTEKCTNSRPALAFIADIFIFGAGP